MDLSRASVVLTGASRGIGGELAVALAARKARLVLVARGRARLEAVAARVRAAGGEARLVAGDVADPETARRAVAEARTAHGGIDLLVNDAAILTEPRPLVLTPHEDWRAVLDVNVLGTVAFLREALPLMVERKRGVCVNLSSGWGRSADADVSPYVASKWAIEGLTRSVALEVPRGVVIVAVNPGIIRTEMLAVAFGRDESSRYPTPDVLAPSFLRLLEQLDADSNGRSLDALDF